MASTDPPETQHRIKVRILVVSRLDPRLPCDLHQLGRPAGARHRPVGRHQRQAARGQGHLGRRGELRRRPALRERRRLRGHQAAPAEGCAAVLGSRWPPGCASSPRRRRSRRSSRRGSSRRGRTRTGSRTRQLVSILKGNNEVVSSQNGKVVLNLRPLVLQLADRIGLKKQLNQKLPPDVGQLEVADSKDLDTARTVTKTHRGARLVLHLRERGAVRPRGRIWRRGAAGWCCSPTASA